MLFMDVTIIFLVLYLSKSILRTKMYTVLIVQLMDNVWVYSRNKKKKSTKQIYSTANNVIPSSFKCMYGTKINFLWKIDSWMYLVPNTQPLARFAFFSHGWHLYKRSLLSTESVQLFWLRATWPSVTSIPTACFTTLQPSKRGIVRFKILLCTM